MPSAPCSPAPLAMTSMSVSPAFAYAEGLKAVQAEDWAGKTRALEALALAEDALPGDPDLAEIRAVLEAL